MEKILKSMDVNFFGNREHKISGDEFFKLKNALLLDVRSRAEAESLEIKLEHHHNVELLSIPVDEIPDKIQEIAKNKAIAIFCPGQIRASIVYPYLLMKGFQDVRVFEGGYAAIIDAIKLGKLLRIAK